MRRTVLDLIALAVDAAAAAVVALSRPQDLCVRSEAAHVPGLQFHFAEAVVA